MSKKTYYCHVEGMIDGAYHKVNDTLLLTSKQAKYLEMAGLVGLSRKSEPAPNKPEPRAATLGMKTRAD